MCTYLPRHRTQAAGVALAIGRRLLDELSAGTLGGKASFGCDLAQGYTGLALLFETLASLEPSGPWSEASRLALTRATNGLGERISLFTGWSGVLAVTAYAARRAGSYSNLRARLGPAIESAVAKSLRRPFAAPALDGQVDLIDGIAGVTVAAGFDRGTGAATTAREYLRWLLADAGERCRTRERSSERRTVNLGVAHGVPGFIAALLDDGAQRDALRPAAEYLVCCARSFEEPGWKSRDFESSARARSAWCYGAPGVSAVLFRAGVLLDDGDIRDLAVASARSACAEPLADRGVQDHGFCHGTAGIIAALHAFGDADDALRRRRDELAAALATAFDPALRFGYRCKNNVVRAFEDRPGLLDGAAGIAAMLATLAGADPSWLRFFGLVVDPPVSG